MIRVPEGRFLRFILVGKVGFPAGTEIDVPTPYFSQNRLGILVVLRFEFAGFAGILYHGWGEIRFQSYKYTKNRRFGGNGFFAYLAFS